MDIFLLKSNFSSIKNAITFGHSRYICSIVSELPFTLQISHCSFTFNLFGSFFQSSIVLFVGSFLLIIFINNQVSSFEKLMFALALCMKFHSLSLSGCHIGMGCLVVIWIGLLNISSHSYSFFLLFFFMVLLFGFLKALTNLLHPCLIISSYL